ncbi:ABC transporter ATP-binding protein/permease [Paratractidigestivibacter faecalis]|uniref:ABC transporter ATP-binding protein/permease n=1 Tax=Paratractidigestivibacter faecalis TaxID=2292441 RepID=UPI000E3C8904|nr:ABC transporter ATP-binding protein/permease [Paratractidigestivibacter faecalis]
MLELKDICKKYVTSSFTQIALDHVSLAFRDNEFVAILGPSGSGKTTTLNIIGGLDHFDSGDLVIDGISTKRYKDRDWDTYRNNRIGFVFQSYNLIPHQTILENVELALTLSGVGRAERKRRAKEALERVGLGQHVDKRPSQLSGGQMQRVAIARALINDPEILLADEPTGALDSTTSVQVMDLLKEVAKDRLVIMVTHNPELAERYATRIVRLADGRITNDSNPFDPATAPHREAKPPRRTSMSFLTALGLSFRNLMTKKGRTAMTAFAGSIGIIGIAAILALSNGVNEYIAKVEEDTLSSYPLSITKQSYDMSGMLGGTSSSEDGAADGSGDSSDSKSAAGDVSQTDAIPQFTLLKDMFASVKSNDLKSLKSYLDSGDAGIGDKINAIQYDYGVTPLVYSADATGDPVKLSPSALTTAMSGGASQTAMAGTMAGTSSIFNEMIDNQDLLAQQYDVVAGRWASAPDEAVLVLNRNGGVSDYTLYSIGVLDPSELDSMVNATMTASGDVDVPQNDVTFTYEDALNKSFKVLSPCETYRANAETGGWTDMSDDAEFMAQKVADGLDLKIVGVVRPNETADSNALSAGVAYTHGLTEELMARAASSPIVQQQLADPNTDVFTGKSFDELQDEAKKGVDLGSLFSVDQAKLQSAFTFDTSKLGNVDFSNIDLSGVSIDPTLISSSLDVDALVSGAPAPDFSPLFDDDGNLDGALSADEIGQIVRLGGQLTQGFVTWWGQNGTTTDPSDPNFNAIVGEKFKEYLATDEAQQILGQISAIAGPELAQRVQQIVTDYVQNQLAPYLQDFFSKFAEQVSASVSAQLQASMTQVMAQVADQVGTSLANLQSAFSVDASAFKSAISFNMGAEDLTSLMSNYANASRLTYDNNLTTLGYADADDPISISIYPKDFTAKEDVLASIDAYNEQARAAGEDDRVIGYTDYMGIIMGSVTDIVNMISLVLIAFVSISLVVSSIMIGIITYISVLERKKEIGILRAIGASKGNVKSVFNAETFIEGLISGVFAILVVVVVSFPVNAYVLKTHQVPNIMSLPWTSALVLVGISVLLTLIAGLIPASSASRRDPVEALRSE